MMNGLTSKIERREFIGQPSLMAMGTSLFFDTGNESFAEGNSTSEAVRRIVALMGNPRKVGNTDTLVIEMHKATQSIGTETEKNYLHEI